MKKSKQGKCLRTSLSAATHVNSNSKHPNDKRKTQIIICRSNSVQYTNQSLVVIVLLLSRLFLFSVPSVLDRSIFQASRKFFEYAFSKTIFDS
jgi:hypothetical protein